MNDLGKFFINNFFLICLAISTILMVVRSYRTKRVVILMPILVVSSAFLLSIIYAVEVWAAKHTDMIFLATLCCALGFMIRPFVLYFFMRITIDKKSMLNIALCLIIFNAVVYLLTLFTFAPDLTKVIFQYVQKGDILEVERGPLFYFSHLIVGILMAYFIVNSIMSLRGRRKYDATASLICAAFVGIAVVLETRLIADNLLNTTIVIACIFYIVHLYQQALIHDPLTNLFDRKAYYADLSRTENKVTGVIVIDMNSLKLLNDTSGHESGDIALKTIADAINQSIDQHNMYGYRMGGDEFVVLSLSKREKDVVKVVEKIKNIMSKSAYTISLGYATRNDPSSISFKEMSKIADEMMYKDKAEYYKSMNIERRHISLED